MKCYRKKERKEIKKNVKISPPGSCLHGRTRALWLLSSVHVVEVTGKWTEKKTQYHPNLAHVVDPCLPIWQSNSLWSGLANQLFMRMQCKERKPKDTKQGLNFWQKWWRMKMAPFGFSSHLFPGVNFAHLTFSWKLDYNCFASKRLE